jgi:FkbH-like protein
VGAGLGVQHHLIEESTTSTPRISLIVIDFDSLIEKASLKSKLSEKDIAFELSLDLFTQELGLHVQSKGLGGVTMIAPFSIKPAFRFDETIRQRNLFAVVETKILELIDGHSEIHLLDIQTPLTKLGTTQSYSARSDLQAQSPLTLDAARMIAEVALCFYASLKSQPYKVLLLDADNTLWKGVLGEVGSEGVGLHPTTYPGNIFWKTQQVLKSLKEAGLLLVLLTKNDRDLVEDHLRRHEYQVLKEEDFVIISADWSPKPNRARNIAAELNLGLDSMVFIDDSDVEVLAMKTQVPEVLTMQVSPNISEYLMQIARLSEVLLPQASETDRTEQYRVRSRTNELKRTAKSHDEFMTMLETKLTLRCNQIQDVNRVSELSERTNQFNSSLTKYTADNLRNKIEQETHQIWIGAVSDSLGDSGTSLAVVSRIDDETLEIEGLWISCRVLGRQLELALLASLALFARSKGLKTVRVVFNASSKNSQVLDFLNSLHPFQISEASDTSMQFQYASDDLINLTPNYLKVIE